MPSHDTRVTPVSVTQAGAAWGVNIGVNALVSLLNYVNREKGSEKDACALR